MYCQIKEGDFKVIINSPCKNQRINVAAYVYTQWPSCPLVCATIPIFLASKNCSVLFLPVGCSLGHQCLS